MNKVYSPFYTAKQDCDVMNGHDKWEPVLTRVATSHCLIIGNKPASRCFLQWNPQSFPQKSGDSWGAWSVFSSPVSSLTGRKDADSVGLMPSIFSWTLFPVSVWSKGSESTTPASRVHSLFAHEWKNAGNNQASSRAVRLLTWLYLLLGKCFPAGSQSN